MRNPRIDPQKGDELEHQDGERRAVMVVRRLGSDAVKYSERDFKLVSECSATQWQEWARETSILNFGADPEQD